MFALHLTQYACGISIQLCAHWSVVVFETHAKRGDTHEGKRRREARIRVFPLKETGSVLVGLFRPLLGPEHLLRSETSLIFSLNILAKSTIRTCPSIAS